MSQSNLFDDHDEAHDSGHAGLLPKPINNDRSSDSFNAFAREKFGVSMRWEWVKVNTLGDYETPRSQAFFQMDGAEYPEVWATGKKKGRTNFKKPKPGTERSLICSFAEYDAFRKAHPEFK